MKSRPGMSAASWPDHSTGDQHGQANRHDPGTSHELCVRPHYDMLSPEAIHATKVRVIDTFGALMGGSLESPVAWPESGSPDAQCRGATVIVRG
jgi:hypothetical protein